MTIYKKKSKYCNLCTNEYHDKRVVWIDKKSQCSLLHKFLQMNGYTSGKMTTTVCLLMQIITFCVHRKLLMYTVFN